MRILPRLAALATVIVSGANCRGSTENNDPTPGDLTISLASPNSDDGAIRLRISGVTTSTPIVAAGSGKEVFLSSTGSTSTRVIVTGAISAGPLLRITVPDTRKDEDYSVVVEEVASTDYAVRPTAGYVLSVEK